MPRRIFDLDVPDRFVTGTVGVPGNRTFFLQARRGAAVVSVVLEKVQVQALAERLGLLLGELSRRGVRVPEALAPYEDDAAPLDEPLVEAFRVGTMTIGWDGEREHVVLEARARDEDEDDEDEDDEDEDDEDDEEAVDDEELARVIELELLTVAEAAESESEDDDEEEAEDLEVSDDDPSGPDLLRVRLTPLRTRAFAERAMRVVAAGRPACPLCGAPLDPGGHICPRRNGYLH